MSMLFILSENNTLFFLVKLIVSKIYWLLTIYLKKKKLLATDESLCIPGGK